MCGCITVFARLQLYLKAVVLSLVNRSVAKRTVQRRQQILGALSTDNALSRCTSATARE